MASRVGFARLGMHFAPVLKGVRYSSGGQGGNVLVPPDQVVPGDSENADGSGDAGAPPPDDQAEGPSAAGIPASMATLLTQIVPPAYMSTLEAVGDGDIATNNAVSELYIQAGLMFGHVVRAAGNQMYTAEVVEKALDSAQGGDKGQPHFHVRWAAGPYMLRPARIYTPNPARAWLDASGLPIEAEAPAVGRLLFILDSPGMRAALVDVRNDDPRLGSGHPNHPATQQRKRMVIAERMNTVNIIYASQLAAYYLTAYGPILDAVEKSEYASPQLKQELAELRNTWSRVPLHPLLAGIAAATRGATAVAAEYDGPVLPIFTDPLKYRSQNEASAPRDFDTQAWAQVPWLRRLARLCRMQGWQALLEEGGLKTAEWVDTDASLSAFFKLGERLRHHINQDQGAWDETVGLLGWTGRSFQVPAASLPLAVTPVEFTDGLALTCDPWQALMGTRAVVPRTIRKFDVTRPMNVRCPIQGYSVLTTPLTGLVVDRFISAWQPALMPKWAWMGEPADKMFLGAVIREFGEAGVTPAEAVTSLEVLVGPAGGEEAATWRAYPQAKAAARTAAGFWPSKAGTVVYDSNGDGAEKLIGNVLTGMRFTKDRGESYALDAEGKYNVFADLDPEYNKGGGLLHIYPPTAKVRLVDAITRLSTKPEERLKEITAEIGTTEVRVLRPEQGLRFLPRIALLTQPLFDRSYALLAQDGRVVEYTTGPRQMVRTGATPEPTQKLDVFTTLATALVAESVER